MGRMSLRKSPVSRQTITMFLPVTCRMDELFSGVIARATVLRFSSSAYVIPTRGEMSFQLIVGPPPLNVSDGSSSGNAVLPGAVLPSLALTALQGAVAQAVAAGAGKLEVAAVVTEGSAGDTAGLAALRDLSADAPLHVVDPAGKLMGTV